MDNERTAEEIAQAYSAAMDSVTLINAVIADPATYANDETVIQRNVDHLKIMIEQDFWTDEDLEPFNAAIAVDTTEFDALFGD
jgi:hypothetical protein